MHLRWQRVDWKSNQLPVDESGSQSEFLRRHRPGTAPGAMRAVSRRSHHEPDVNRHLVGRQSFGYAGADDCERRQLRVKLPIKFATALGAVAGILLMPAIGAAQTTAQIPLQFDFMN